MPTVIYEPRGRAREYSPLAVNLYRGCSHGCTYCYAPAAQFTTHSSWTNCIAPRKDILKLVERDARAMSGDPRPVLLCFLCDPYQPADERVQLTRRTIEILGEHRMSAQVLTKGGERAIRDFDLLKRYGFRFGTSLVFADDGLRRVWEPHAATVESRVKAIRQAHDRGIFTWCSVEPVIDPEQALAVIRELGSAVDFWKVGKLNHMTFAKSIDWAAFYDNVTGLLKSLGRDYYIKEDLWRIAKCTTSNARFRSERTDIRLLCPSLA